MTLLEKLIGSQVFRIISYVKLKKKKNNLRSNNATVHIRRPCQCMRIIIYWSHNHDPIRETNRVTKKRYIVKANDKMEELFSRFLIDFDKLSFDFKPHKKKLPTMLKLTFLEIRTFNFFKKTKFPACDKISTFKV